jgi:CheY-like chemotaxis protein/PAS domain-containing protein/HPt (histidine-containing phosphotransfer) domain-containing protein
VHKATHHLAGSGRHPVADHRPHGRLDGRCGAGLSLTSPRLRTWAGLGTALACTVMLFVLQLAPGAASPTSLSPTVELQRALDELETGALHLSLAQGSDSPWNHDQGLALLRHGVQSMLDQMGRQMPPPELAPRLKATVPTLAASLEVDTPSAREPMLQAALIDTLSAVRDWRQVAQREMAAREQTRERATVGALALLALALALLTFDVWRPRQKHLAPRHPEPDAERQQHDLAAGSLQIAAVSLPTVAGEDLNPRPQPEHGLADPKAFGAEAWTWGRLAAATLASDGEGILACDETGKLVLWNRRLLELTGLPEALLHDNRHDQVVAHLAAAVRQPATLTAMLADEPADPETVTTFAFAGDRVLELRSAPLQDQDAIAGRVWRFRDVTARTQAPAAATGPAEPTAFLQVVADALAIRVSYWNRERQCTFANEAFRRWQQPPGNHALGLSLDRFVLPEQGLHADRRVTAVLAGQAQQFERHERRRDGHVVHTTWHYVPDRRDDTVQGFALLVHESTERGPPGLPDPPHPLAAAQDGPSADPRMVGELLASMSRDVRAPMNTIASLTRQLRSGTVDDTQSRQLDKLGEASRDLLTAINNVLDLSRIAAGELRLEDTPFTLPAVLDQVRRLITDAAEAKGLTVRVEASAVPERWRGDPARLRQALLNLAEHAVQATTEGTVTLQARVLDSDNTRIGNLVAAPRQLHLTVMAADRSLEARPFEPALAADAHSLPTALGAGAGAGAGASLGLAVTAHLARLMGGDAGTVKRPGQGRRWWFTAVLHPVEPDVADAAPPASLTNQERQLRTRHAGARVLVAEDHPINQEVARQLLQAAGLQVDVAADGREAVAQFSAQAHDLVLMDMQMPTMGGLEATRHIRRLPHGASVPIIAMTANAFADDRAACLGAGMVDFIAKPVDPEALYAALNRWLDKRSQPQAATAGGPRPTAVTHEHAAATAGPWPEHERAHEHEHEHEHKREHEASASGFDIAGLNADDGLRLLRGDSAKYTRLLRTFVQCHGSDISALRRPALDGDSIARSLHALRGSASAIGANELYQHTVTLDERLHASGTAATLGVALTDLADELESLIEHIERGLAG